jgi:hypothetical protein
MSKLQTIQRQHTPPVVVFDVTGAAGMVAFRDWLKAHPAGFCLAFRSATEAVLHRADCHDALDTQGAQKVCGLASRELRQWAARKCALLLTCPSCKAD